MTQALAIQIIIGITGGAAVWLSQSISLTNRRSACLFGLIGQPFWFYVTITGQQWGMFVLSLIYTAAWIKGLILHFSVQPLESE